MGRPSTETIGGERLRRIDEALRELPETWSSLRVARNLKGAFTPFELRLATSFWELRARTRRRFPAGELVFLTRQGLEQASAQRVAAARAEELQRIAQGSPSVLDATCGLGADLLACAAVGCEVTGADRDPLHASFARAHLQRAGHRPRIVIADAERPALPADWLLVDPDRRAGGRRTLDPACWSPPLDTVLALARGFEGACVKLPPSHPLEQLEELDQPWRARWVSHRRELVEVSLWLGAGASAAPSTDDQGADPRDEGPQEVLLLHADGTSDLLRGRRGHCEPLGASEARAVRWIADPDPGLVRARLLEHAAERAGLAPLGPMIAFLASVERPEHVPGLRLYRVIGQTSADPKKVRKLLGQQDIGPVTVIARGHPEGPPQLERKFRGPGTRRGIVLVSRLERGHAAYLVEHSPEPDSDRLRGGVVGDEGFEPPTSSV